MCAQKTMDAIVAAADLPMSIIIVGVGNADFGMFARKCDSSRHMLHIINTFQRRSSITMEVFSTPQFVCSRHIKTGEMEVLDADEHPIHNRYIRV